MLQTLATVFLLGMMAAFAICAVLVNEGGRRRRKARPEVRPETITIPVEEAGSSRAPDGDRRLPVGDFLFGALYLNGSEPLPFSKLADAAAGSGMSVAQVLSWVERAEESGLIERVPGEGTGESDGHPAVRLTEAGMDLARNNRRRSADRAAEPSAADATRALRP